ncbi:MAG: hypothetical protein PHU53_02955 [Thermoplasmata archaeon]|nr:hypothetical protein [Thermoplasmata archaeon]
MKPANRPLSAPISGLIFISQMSLFTCMDEATLRKMEGIIRNSPCPVGCRCNNLKPEELCKARRAGLDVLLECLEPKPEECTFSMSFGGTYYCKCGTRMEIAKLLGE